MVPVLGLLLGALAGAAPAAAGEPTFRVERIELSGADGLPAGEWQPLLDAVAGRELDFAALEALRAALEARFHAAGWRLARVRIPAQTVDGGRIRFEVVSPRVEQVEVIGNRHASAENWRANFPMLREGEPPNLVALDKALTLAGENPAKRPQVAFAAGTAAGTVKATIRAEDAPPASWVAFLDNTGNSQTGRLRYGLAWQHGNLFDADHQINAQIISAPHDPDDPDRLSLLPSRKVRIFGLGYRVPFYSLGAVASLTAGYSDVNSGQVDQLFTIRGRGSNLGVNWTRLLDRPQDGPWRGWDLRWFAGADWRDFKSQLLFGATDLGVPITLHPVSVGISGSRAPTPQAPAGWQFHAGVWHNLPGGADGGDAAFSASRAGATPYYTLLRYGLAGNMPLGDWRLDLRLDGQWSNDMLVPAEQFSAGGVSSVRGFNARGISGDNGLLVQIEAQSPPLLAGGGEAAQLRAVCFLDAAQTRRNHPTALESASNSIASVGVGLRANWRQTVLRVDAGKPVHQRTGLPSESGTVHFSLATRF